MCSDYKRWDGWLGTRLPVSSSLLWSLLFLSAQQLKFLLLIGQNFSGTILSTTVIPSHEIICYRTHFYCVIVFLLCSWPMMFLMPSGALTSSGWWTCCLPLTQVTYTHTCVVQIICINWIFKSSYSK